MFPIKPFPCALAACFGLAMFILPVAAQQADTFGQHQTGHVNQVTVTTNTEGIPQLENDPVILSETDLAPPPLHLPPVGPPTLLRINQSLLTAIGERLGAPYVYGAAGPYSFDCSGFVWSVFQEIGVRFCRGSARTLWERFAPAREDEEVKFGTLVFFNGLRHVGIVADEHGFYHASRTNGVAYSPFNQYWLDRIDGFRRVPLQSSLAGAE